MIDKKNLVIVNALISEGFYHLPIFSRNNHTNGNEMMITTTIIIIKDNQRLSNTNKKLIHTLNQENLNRLIILLCKFSLGNCCNIFIIIETQI
jgi:hypothetical protein